MMSQKMLDTMYSYSYFLVDEAIRSIDHDSSLKTTGVNTNCANWILGHIITSRCNVLAMLKIDPPWDFNLCKPYLPDSKPLSPDDEVVKFDEMKEILERTQNILLKTLESMEYNDLEGRTGENTLGEDLAGYAVHEAYHAAELGAIQFNLGLKEEV